MDCCHFSLFFVIILTLRHAGMPQIRKLVREALPSAEMNTHIDPDITVAYGAASVID
jgi:molecular chaperone DnaK (HSP70)